MVYLSLDMGPTNNPIVATTTKANIYLFGPDVFVPLGAYIYKSLLGLGDLSGHACYGSERTGQLPSAPIKGL